MNIICILSHRLFYDNIMTIFTPCRRTTQHLTVFTRCHITAICCGIRETCIIVVGNVNATANASGIEIGCTNTTCDTSTVTASASCTSVSAIVSVKWKEKGEYRQHFGICKWNGTDSIILFRLEYIAPLSFEQALAMGRTGRVLPSPVLNGFKPKSGLNTRHSDSDEEDWC